MLFFKRKAKKQGPTFMDKVQIMQDNLNNLQVEKYTEDKKPVTEEIVSRLSKRGIEMLVKTPQDIRMLVEYMDTLPEEERETALEVLQAIA